MTIFKGTEGLVYLGDDVISRVKNFTVKIDSTVESTYECGSRDPCDIKDGIKKYSGTLERPIINGTLFAKAIGYQTLEADGTYTITKADYVYPETAVTGENMPQGAYTYKTIYNPILQGSLTIKRGGVAWGTENTDYVVDYADGLITFATPTDAAAWTVDYSYGRSYTLTGKLEVLGTSQRTDITVFGLLFNNDTLTLSTGETQMENLEYTASGVYSLATGEPFSGI